MTRFQRPAGRDAEQRTTTLELFHDLAFVFAITQVSHLLLAHLNWKGAGEAALALLVVWWAWNYTTWFTNELDPESGVVRLLILGITLLSLLMAVAVPHAFGDRALLFAGAYVAIQVGRGLFLTFVPAEAGTIARERSLRLLVWFAIAGVGWIAGALAGGTARTVLWLLALAADYAAPAVLFPVPGRPAISASAWQITVSHFAERFQLFIILALGESIVITGATTSGLDLNGGRLAAFVLAFAVTAALWWLYFSFVAQRSERDLDASADRVTTARDAYTYLHVVMAAGVIVSAVGDEVVIAHPDRHLGVAETLVVVGGPALYLLAHVLFRLRLAGSVSIKRTAGAAGCLACAALAPVAPAWVVALLVLLVLVAVIALEERSGRRRRAAQPSAA